MSIVQTIIKCKYDKHRWKKKKTVSSTKWYFPYSNKFIYHCKIICINICTQEMVL